MTNPYGMSDGEFLSCLGPSWEEMSQEARANYPRATTEPTPLLETVTAQPAPVPVISLADRAQAARDRRDRLTMRVI